MQKRNLLLAAVLLAVSFASTASANEVFGQDGKQTVLACANSKACIDSIDMNRADKWLKYDRDYDEDYYGDDDDQDDYYDDDRYDRGDYDDDRYDD